VKISPVWNHVSFPCQRLIHAKFISKLLPFFFVSSAGMLIVIIKLLLELEKVWLMHRRGTVCVIR